jgi:hypothetical protein
MAEQAAAQSRYEAAKAAAYFGYLSLLNICVSDHCLITRRNIMVLDFRVNLLKLTKFMCNFFCDKYLS